MSAFDQIRQAYFGRTRMPRRLNPQSRRRLIWTSLAPGMIIVATVIHAALSIAYHNLELYGVPYLSEPAPLIWRRLGGAANGLQSLSSVALALLVAAGVQRWSRNEGSWMLVVGAGLAGVALVLGAFVVGSYVVLDQYDADGKVYSYEVWGRIAGTFGYMAVGYFFLAYRGASAPEEPDEVSAATNPE